jgi:hypothetical protein
MGLGFERPEGSPNSNGLRVYLESLDPTVQCQGLKRVNHFGFTRRPSLPVYSGRRTSRDRPGWSVLCQQETHAAQQTALGADRPRARSIRQRVVVGGRLIIGGNMPAEVR